MGNISTVFVTGGAGYVGSVLVPKLLDKGYKVKVLDLYLFGDDVLDEVKDHSNLIQIKGDLRDANLLAQELPGCDAVIHLACISNDPSFELNPELGKSINYDAFLPLVEIAKNNKVKLFVYASSSSVYGIKEEDNVTEDLPLLPLTDYSKYKMMCEDVLLMEQTDDFTTLIIRPSTVCGYSPRLRLDLSVNILTNLAINNGKITVFGGQQKRPNIHIDDITDLYVNVLELPKDKLAGKIFNAGYENFTIMEIAEKVKSVIGDNIEIVTTPSDDNRSYHVSSQKIKQELGFVAKHSLEDAIKDLQSAFDAGKIPDPMNDMRYYNIKTMNAVNLK